MRNDLLSLIGDAESNLARDFRTLEKTEYLDKSGNSGVSLQYLKP